MGIVNRTLDSTEQTKDIFTNLEDTVTATSDQVYHAPHGMEIQGARICAEGLSGAPSMQLQIQRFVTGAGETQIPLGAALVMVAVGTSGPMTYTFSTTTLMAGDQVVATHAVANTGADQMSIALVVKATQDIKSWSY